LLDIQDSNYENGPQPSLGSLITGFKSAVTREANKTYLSTPKSIWQRNYYEHVIRNERELEKIREYIAGNPAQWSLDRENPDAKKVKHKTPEPWEV